MSKGLKVIKSINVTPAVMTGTDVAEDSNPLWSAGTTYASGARVHLTSTHKVYESVQDGNIGKSPENEPLWWVEVSPTNRWKAFDLSTTTKTSFTTACYYQFVPGTVVNAVGLLNFSGVRQIRIRLTDPAYGVVYDKTSELSALPQESSWYSWFMEEKTNASQFVATDLPSYPFATLRIDISAFSTTTGEIGAITFGTQKTIGTVVRAGANLGMQDFSRKERNQWGDTELVQRAYAKRVQLNMLLENKNLDNAYNFLVSLRATPCLWIASDHYASLVVFGFFSGFDITIPYAQYSECSIDLESLT